MTREVLERFREYVERKTNTTYERHKRRLKICFWMAEALLVVFLALFLYFEFRGSVEGMVCSLLAVVLFTLIAFAAADELTLIEVIEVLFGQEER